MLNRHAREFFTRLFTPLARVLLKLGVSPDAVTLAGTAGVSLAALVLFPLGQLFWGVVVITLFVFSDVIDGIMARTMGRTGRWGSFLDSTLDRVQDSSIFLGLALWYLGNGHEPATGSAAVVAILLGNLVSYARAKAESLGYTANVGIAERAERLVSVLVVAGLCGLGLPTPFLFWTLVLLAAASAVTIVQRILTVRSQARAESGPA
ncbi:phosphatidylinositol phosphate synthase [Sinomonas albida]|uniref:phosphatidylinositol phosphate synthase n=1 Tax=Sinomonas albida TaxID=369942 RepID=UPI00301A55C9